MAKGSFLVSQAAAKVLIDQGIGGDIVYISSKNAVFAGPNNVAYGAAKADQAHQVRLLAAELGEYGIRVNGVNPDGVVRGSGIFAKGWGAQRAAVYGVPESELGAFYAQRTLLKREVLPEHVAAAVFALTGWGPVATRPVCTCRSTPAWLPRSCAEERAMWSTDPSRSVDGTACCRGSSRGRRGSAWSRVGSARTGRSSPTLLPQLQASARRVSERFAALDCEVVDVGFISDAQEGAAAAEKLRLADCDLIVGLPDDVHDRVDAGAGRAAQRRAGAAAQPAADRVDGPRDLRHRRLARVLRRLPAAGDGERVRALRHRLPVGLRATSRTSGPGRGSSGGSRRPAYGPRSGTGGTGCSGTSTPA